MTDLVRQVTEKGDKIRTTSLDISFNELSNMYKEGELIISPDYQRLFRWSEKKQSRFIETVMLELPIPPIFVIETEEGIYELIDGLQRISSYLNFKGELNENDSLKLQGCDLIPELNGHKFNTLPTLLKLKLKRNFVRMEVLRKESDNHLKYHMFKRLNSGGELLTEQEIRNCTIRILNPKINKFIEDMAKNEFFKRTISKIDEEDIKRKKDEELVLRFFAFKNDLTNFSFPIDEFLTDYMEKIATEDVVFDYEKERDIFENTFKIFDEILGENIFSYENSNGNYRNIFTQYYYDALTLGIQKFLKEIIELSDYKKLFPIIRDIKKDKKIYNLRTANKSSLTQKINIVRIKLIEFFNEC